MTMRRLTRAAAAAGLALLLGHWTPALAETPDQLQLPAGAEVAGYVGSDVSIPMRDGAKLHAEVWRPKDASGPLPILMTRSPYGFGLEAVRGAFAGQLKELAQEKFIFVLEDIRGRFGSGGDFVMLRPKAPAGGVDESTDTYDTIDWLVKSLPDNSGKVGMFGISYGGWTTAMALIDPHPALKAVSVQASPEDMFLGDDFHHNGAFRLDYGWEYAAALETDGRTLNVFGFGQDDPYGFLLKQPNLADLDRRALGKTLPTWRNFVDHPSYDGFWKAQVTTTNLPKTPHVPNLIVAGWWDQEDFYGPMTIYKRQEKGDTGGKNFLVVGPWNHGGWARADGRSYGPFDLGSDTSGWFRGEVETPWFRYWLKGEGRLDQPEALVFETGSNQWKRYDAWPPKLGVAKRSLYLHAGGVLSFDPPTASEGKPDSFVSDPADPVPYRARPISPVIAEHSTWPVWMADDQSPFSARKDVLTWTTAPLEQAVTLRGDVMAKLFASTTGTDADWVVKLIDVYPDDDSVPAELRGRQMLITGDVFRGRFRGGFEHPRPLKPGKVLDYAIDLHSASHVFARGHRIAVQVQSSWFPLIDRNPQTFTPSIFTAGPADYQARTHAVSHSPAYPSQIVLDLAEGG
jgi:putative CocE/NonD family hydrolase